MTVLNRISDKDRKDWVNADESLRDAWKESGKSRRRWVKENAEMIDDVITGSRIQGSEPAHSLTLAYA